MQPIAELLTVYYQAPQRLPALEKRRRSREARLAYLTTEYEDTDVSFSGLVARYAPSTGHGSEVSDPVSATAMRLLDKAAEEMAKLRLEIFEIGQEIAELERLVDDVDAIVSHLGEFDQTLLTLHYRDGLTNDQIAAREYAGADESIPRKRLARLTADIARALHPMPLQKLRFSAQQRAPNPRRNSAENRQQGVLSLVRSSFAE